MSLLRKALRIYKIITWVAYVIDKFDDLVQAVIEARDGLKKDGSKEVKEK